MAERHLEEILKTLLRTPMSQTALSQKLHLSSSHISSLVRTLLDQGFVSKEEDLTLEEEGKSTVRRRQRLKLSVQPHLITAVVVNTLWECSLALYALGELQPRVVVNLKQHAMVANLCQELQAGIKQALASAHLAVSDLKLLVFATQASLEQGYNGIVFRGNVLDIADGECPLAATLHESLWIQCYVCNFAYAPPLVLTELTVFRSR